MSDTVPLSVLKDQPGVQGLAQLGRNALERINELERELAEAREQLRLCNVDQFTTAAELAEAQEELNDKRKFAYAVEQALDGMKGDYVEIIVALRRDAEKYRYCFNAAPPRREWVGLTGPEVDEAYCSVSDKEWAIGGLADARVFFCAIEAKLREKNGG